MSTSNNDMSISNNIQNTNNSTTPAKADVHAGLITPTCTYTPNENPMSTTITPYSLNEHDKKVNEPLWINSKNDTLFIPQFYQTSKTSKSCTTIAASKSIYREYNLKSSKTQDGQMKFVGQPTAQQIFNQLLNKVPGKVKPEQIQCICKVIPVLTDGEQEFIEFIIRPLARSRLNDVKNLIFQGRLLMTEVPVKKIPDSGVNSDITKKLFNSDIDPTHMVNVNNISKTGQKLCVNNHWDPKTYNGIQENFELGSNIVLGYWYFDINIHSNKPTVYNLMSYTEFGKVKQNYDLTFLLMRLQAIAFQRKMQLKGNQKDELKKLYLGYQARDMFYPINEELLRIMSETRAILHDTLTSIAQQIELANSNGNSNSNKKISNKNNSNNGKMEKNDDEKIDFIWGQECAINNGTKVQYSVNCIRHILSGQFFKMSVVDDNYNYSDFTGAGKTKVLKRWYTKFLFVLGLIKNDSNKNNNIITLNAPKQWKLKTIKELLNYLPDKRKSRPVNSAENLVDSLMSYRTDCLPKQKIQTKTDDKTTKCATYYPTSAESEIVRDLTEKLYYVTESYEMELEQNYELPDGPVIKIDVERFRGPEVIFQPNLIDKEQECINRLCYNSSMKCDVDIKKDLYNNVLDEIVERIAKET
eukprot:413789_1